MEAQGFRHRDEVAQMPHFHAPILLVLARLYKGTNKDLRKDFCLFNLGRSHFPMRPATMTVHRPFFLPTKLPFCHSSIRCLLPIGVILFLLLVAFRVNAHAEETPVDQPVTDGKEAFSTQSEPTLLPSAPESPWQFDVYGWPWLPEFVGDLTVGGRTVPIDLDQARVLRALRGAFFGGLDLRYKHWTFALEGFYAKIGLPVDPDTLLIRHIGVSIAVADVDWSVAYRPLEDRHGYLDLVVGARYLYLNLGLNLAPGPLGKTLLTQRSLSGTQDTIDPYTGVRGRLNLSRRYYVAARGDYGSFGIGSRVDWLAYGGLGAQLGHHWNVEAGYRYSYLDYRHEGFRFNMHIDGTQITVGYTF
ncbi:MAG: hypothetical protein INR62_11080 [Rhodospirillales bacterium]|nr:hypothetical protein [Acetobacter sp.]